MHEHNKIHLTAKGKVVVGLLVGVVAVTALYFLSWVITDYPETTLREDPIQCVNGTFKSYEGTCEPESVEL